MSGLNSPYVPKHDEMISVSRLLFKMRGEDAVLDWLSEVASNDFKCPDRCSAWAVRFYDENQEEIERVSDER